MKGIGHACQPEIGGVGKHDGEPAAPIISTPAGVLDDVETARLRGETRQAPE
jgi:hypothetical protein